jgi:two-component system KDP operon response regulator KdpE
MQQSEVRQGPATLPPLLGLRLLVVSSGLERAHDRGHRLEGMGYRVTACGDPREVEAFVVAAEPDAIVVDIERDAFLPSEVVARLRGATDVPILVIGRSNGVAETVRCFEAGADEFAAHNCHPEEIDVRLRAIFRRARLAVANCAAPPEVIRIGELEIDPAGRIVRKRGEAVPLSPTEYRLLLTLAERPGQVVPTRALITRVWGNQYAGETHYLRLYVRYLRRKLEDDPRHPQYIVNRWGSGYALEGPGRAA